MNKKQFLVLLVLVVVLGVWGFNHWRTQNSWNTGSKITGQKLLGEFDVNAVAQIAITQGTTNLLLAKKDDTWRVTQRGDYPANFSEISSLLLKLKELKIIQAEQVGPSQLPRLELAAGGKSEPTVVEFRDATGKAFKTLTLGKKHMRSGDAGPMGGADEDGGWPDGRYVMAGEAKDSVALISDPLTDLEPDAKRWLKKDFIKVEKPKSIAVTYADSTNSWTLTREMESAEWTLANAAAKEKLDSSKVSGVTSPFSYPTINDVAVGLTPEQSGIDHPTTIAIQTFDGFEYTIKVGAKTNDNYLITATTTATLPKERTAKADEKPEEKDKADKEFAERQKQLQEKLTKEQAYAPWTYEISSWTVDALLKKRGELLQENQPEEPTADTSVTLPEN